jgi:Fe-S oxidoreductase
MSSYRTEILYWVGCVASYLTQDTAKTTVKILKYANIDFKMLGVEEGCCGLPLLTIGQQDIFNNVAKSNVEKILNEDVRCLVTSCAGCFRTFRESYPQILGPLPFKVLHFSEYLEKLINAGDIKFNKEMPVKVTYHDPCHLGRLAGLYDPPRNVIKAIPGVKFVEMEKSRVDSRCCGGGGGIRFAFPGLSTSIAANRIRSDAAPTGAEILVTACPSCVKNLKDGIVIAETLYNIGEIEVLDLPELVYRALTQ